MKSYYYILLIIVLFTNCTAKTEQKSIGQDNPITPAKELDLVYDTTSHTAHIFVALCDNKYQGIVPVPAGIGNGQDPKNNLYWGASLGLKSYFNKSKEWKLLRKYKVDDIVLERLIYKNTSKNFYVIADAYDGKEIEKTTTDFLYSASGQNKDTIQIDGKTLGIHGNANLLGYVGHDGLMDFKVKDDFYNTDNKKRDIIIYACYSKHFFGPLLEDANINPLVWTTHLMAPEAYIMHDALTGYVKKESNEAIRSRAAQAYSKYQKCSLKASRNLFVTGW